MTYQTPRLIILLSLVFFLYGIHVSKIISAEPTAPTPTPWPPQFHSVLFTNYSGAQQLIDLWYDWPNGRNFNIIQNQLGKLLYDLEWKNGTTFYYTLDSSKECKSIQIQVGILRPTWLDGATYLGQQHMDGFLCNVWEKEDFIGYYEDIVTKRPVYWEYYSGLDAGRGYHVMTFEVGAVLEDAKWQVPVYCFDKKGTGNTQNLEYAENGVPKKCILKGVCGSSMPLWNREGSF